jgi:predicted DNA-binding transcriptional regulator YafY
MSPTVAEPTALPARCPRVRQLGTSARPLQLLSLLESGRQRSAEALAVEMSTTTRTVRRDVVRLRDLGYPVDMIYGRGGGYRLDAATTLPPLMFDADELFRPLR